MGRDEVNAASSAPGSVPSTVPATDDSAAWYANPKHVLFVLLGLSEKEVPAFFASVWENKPYYAKSGSLEELPLFTGPDLELAIRANVSAYATNRGLEYIKDVNMLKRVKNPEDGDWWSGRLPIVDGVPLSFGLIQSAMNKGFTAVINRMNYRTTRLNRLVTSMERLLGATVNVNLYTSPPNGQGFEAHFDVMDVFVLQITGQKIWSFYEPLVDLPKPHEKFKPATRDLIPYDELRTVTMSPGDILYMPRGWIHEARTSRLPSTHLTIGVESESYLWETVLRTAMSIIDEGSDVLSKFNPVRIYVKGREYFVDIPWFRVIDIAVENVGKRRPQEFRRRFPMTTFMMSNVYDVGPQQTSDFIMDSLAKLAMLSLTNATLPSASSVAEGLANEIRAAHPALRDVKEISSDAKYRDSEHDNESIFYQGLSMLLSSEAFTESVMRSAVSKVLSDYREERAAWIKAMQVACAQHQVF